MIERHCFIEKLLTPPIKRVIGDYLQRVVANGNLLVSSKRVVFVYNAL